MSAGIWCLIAFAAIYLYIMYTLSRPRAPKARDPLAEALIAYKHSLKRKEHWHKHVNF